MPYLGIAVSDSFPEVIQYQYLREPVGPYIKVPARRTHIRFNNLSDPAEIPWDTDYSSLFSSDVPVVIKHTRLDSRQSENALLSTVAFPSEK